LQCVTVCCSVLQCVAVCCSVMQCAAVCCSVLQCVAVCFIDHEICIVVQGVCGDTRSPLEAARDLKQQLEVCILYVCARVYICGLCGSVRVSFIVCVCVCVCVRAFACAYKKFYIRTYSLV